MGAYHQSELPLLFGTHGNYRRASTKLETAVSEAMQDAWRAFAEDQETGLAGLGWAQFSSNHDAIRVFGGNGTVAWDTVGELKSYEDKC